ncbi:HAD-IIA family hydrolase [Kytococcus sedentarius]|uniref:HAD-IIA family hydrolase n=1 Tax=Kytococcus sedentarius TaxID=1276 RepID=UPI00385124E5
MSTESSVTTLTGIRGVVCDVDGVVHAGERVFTEAVEALNAWMAAGLGVVFVTNNASRAPEELAARLTEDGVDVGVDQVLTGAMAGAHVVAEQVPAGSSVFVAGSEALARATADSGLVPTDDPLEAAAVVQGYAPSMTYQRLHDAARAVTAGAVWVATNRDLTLPTAWGQAPGNGAYVAAVARATGQEPLVACKPEGAVYAMALQRLGCSADEAVAIGDRLETDVAGANRAGLHSVLVTTGVHGVRDVEALLAAGGDADQEPDHLVASLAALRLS